LKHAEGNGIVEPHVVVSRGGYLESTHLFAVAVADVDGRVHFALGDVERPRFLRSAAKPFVTAALLAHGAAERFGWTPAEIALASASHAGEPEHVAGVRSILEKAGLREDVLRCGSHPPKDQTSAAELIRAGLSPTAVYNNCSGQHAALASVAAEFRSHLEYIDPAHPIHALYEQALRADVDPDLTRAAIDGCGLPTQAVPLVSLAKGYARLANPQAASERFAAALETVLEAMTLNPYFVGGSTSLDTALMFADSSMVSKHGAEAVYAAGFSDRRLGIAIKILDGSPRAVPYVLRAVLEQTDLLSEELDQALSGFTGPLVNGAGRPVGEIEVRETGVRIGRAGAGKPAR